jgi:hypothetical protein
MSRRPIRGDFGPELTPEAVAEVDEKPESDLAIEKKSEKPSFSVALRSHQD